MRTRWLAEKWAQEQFVDADLGDARRRNRFVRLVARAAENPSGKLSKVLKCPRELDAGYDFVESGHVAIAQLERVVGCATARACHGESFVHVAVDGSSLNIVDGKKEKGLGRIGADTRGGRGLKVMTALAVAADGATVGVLSQSFWARAAAPKQRSERQKRRARSRKKTDQKETRHWLDTIERGSELLKEVGARGWFQLDREGDAWPTLLTLAACGHRFTVRSAWDRGVETTRGAKRYLRAHMAAAGRLEVYAIDVPPSPTRRARRARMVLRAGSVTLMLRDRRTDQMHPLLINVVWARELGTTPRGEKPLDWMLLTNAPIDTPEAARAVVAGYSMRWRIEDFHRSWKGGACHVEDTQLRSRDAIIRWATILAVVAARIERLKHLARTDPERPATAELTNDEILVLIALKRRYKKKTEDVPDATPSIAQAVRWIADIGGYTGKSSGGPPGSIVIARGLDRLRSGVEGVLAMRGSSK